VERRGDARDAFLRFELRADGWVPHAVFISASGVIGLALVLLDACSVMLTLVMSEKDAGSRKDPDPG
jgi:hypothetical protein